MANIIAVIWDCDKTLIDGYMQDPIFEDYEINPQEFWSEVDRTVKKYADKGIKVNRDTYYLNQFIHYAHDGRIPGLNNAKLREYGQRLNFYPGIPDLLKKTSGMFRDDCSYAEYGIQVEHYIVSTGFSEVIKGSVLKDLVAGIWGCELIEEDDAKGNPVIGEVAYTIDNTTKTRAIFEINKGLGIDVNAKIPKENRRVQFEHMIYIADGPSDIPAFSLIHQNGGATFAVYPEGDLAAMRQVEQMRADGRVDMYAEANYSENRTAQLWITNKIRELADSIRSQEQEKIRKSVSEVPHHLA